MSKKTEIAETTFTRKVDKYGCITVAGYAYHTDIPIGAEVEIKVIKDKINVWYNGEQVDVRKSIYKEKTYNQVSEDVSESASEDTSADEVEIEN